MVSVLPINEKIINLSLNSAFSDLEDAIQYLVAKENNIEILITRNKKHFKKAEIVIMDAEEYLNTY